MHHKNHKNSSSNHSNPSHIQPKSQFPTSPAPQRTGKSVLSRFREKFQEKPATAEEIQQLRLNTVREELKTRKVLAKNKRPSRFSFGGGFQSAPPSYRKSSSRAPPSSGSWLLSENSGMGDSFFSNQGSGPSLDFITGANSNQKGRRGKQEKSGLESMFT